MGVYYLSSVMIVMYIVGVFKYILVDILNGGVRVDCQCIKFNPQQVIRNSEIDQYEQLQHSFAPYKT